ncbi:MAG: DUF89 family protein [Deltaproteobacteria bacterium]|nr:DUF89 family protein [Deltaproteobacteria bacterium]
MRTWLDCIPCLVRQALDAARATTSDPRVHERVVRETLALAASMDLARPPPALGQIVHRRLRAWTGVDDPYRETRQRFNRLVLEALPALAARVDRAEDPLGAALALSVAANTIDLGPHGSLTSAEILEALEAAQDQPLHGNPEAFREAEARGGDILFLADNAGEIAVDRLLVERLGPARVTLVVRGAPVLNDAVLDDARAVGLSERVEVIDNGSDAPGTLLSDCSDTFRDRFRRADLVLAKGQGNYETLSDADREVYCLFKVKCALVSAHTGLPLGAHALLRTGAPYAPRDSARREDDA